MFITIATTAPVCCDILVSRRVRIAVKSAYYLYYARPSVRPSVGIYHCGCHWTDLSEICYCRLL